MHSSAGIPYGMGFPIRKFSHHSLVAGSVRLIAGSYVLHRLLTPRHPPSALTAWSCRPDPDGKTVSDPRTAITGYCMHPASTFPHPCLDFSRRVAEPSRQRTNVCSQLTQTIEFKSCLIRSRFLLVITASVAPEHAGGVNRSNSCLSIMHLSKSLA